MRKLTLSLAAAGTLLAGGVAYAQEPPKPEPRPALTRADVEQRTNAVFARMDANKDGVLNKADREFRKEARRTAAFERLDANKDGSITREEFTAGRERPQVAQAEPGKRPAPRMGRAGPRGPMAHRGPGRMGFGMGGNADADRDGSVTQAEFAAAALARFDNADVNKDGTVTREEMRSQRHDRRDHRRPPQAG